VIRANGYICRESFSLGDRAESFYMIRSMGLASAIGLGMTLARDDGHRGLHFILVKVTAEQAEAPRVA
jgi:hypothetical protein